MMITWIIIGYIIISIIIGVIATVVEAEIPLNIIIGILWPITVPVLSFVFIVDTIAETYKNGNFVWSKRPKFKKGDIVILSTTKFPPEVWEYKNYENYIIIEVGRNKYQVMNTTTLRYTTESHEEIDKHGIKIDKKEIPNEC
jgi:hypothetical protein